MPAAKAALRRESSSASRREAGTVRSTGGSESSGDKATLPENAKAYPLSGAA
jgi:hypothetical protein